MRVQFFGAAGEVTGSCHLVHIDGRRVLLDCGMMQGGRDERARNRAKFPFDVSSLDAVVLSHAHIDHVGRLPLLVKRGYRGRIHTQRATAELARIMLLDAAKLAGADAARENRHRERRGQTPVFPPYDEEDVHLTLRQFEPMPYDAEHEILRGIHLRLRDAGHILGAAIVELSCMEDDQRRTLVFSGDIGPRHAPIMRDPTPVEHADLVLMESTYGDRLHRSRDATIDELGGILRRAHADRGMVLIPAFAVGRSQEILYWLARNRREWQLDNWEIVLDSPMAREVVTLYERHQHLFDDEARALWAGADNPMHMPNLRMVSDVAESRALNERTGGAIIIAGSGMCNGGRIVQHLRHHLWRESTHVVFPGFQAVGTLGRMLVDGASTVRIQGEQVAVKAQRHTVGGLSAHADQRGLLEWYGAFRNRPPVWLVHGEDNAREPLAAKIRQQFGSRVELARPGESASTGSDAHAESSATRS
jgi:metallo-beta-lactamase family protein